MRIYVDTSVIGGYFDPEFEVPTRRLFDAFRRGEVRMVLSTLTVRELAGAPKRVADLAIDVREVTDFVEESDESRELANRYIAAGAVGESSRPDAEHIAIATIAKVDVLVSWNFRHIVNVPRIRRYNLVNQEFGYPHLEIRTPTDIVASW